MGMADIIVNGVADMATIVDVADMASSTLPSPTHSKQIWAEW